MLTWAVSRLVDSQDVAQVSSHGLLTESMKPAHRWINRSDTASANRLRTWLTITVGSFALATTCCAIAAAQDVEVVRGRVSDIERRPISGVQVTVTGGQTGSTKMATSDSSGLFRVIFEDGERSYRIAARKIGYSLALRQASRTGPSNVLVVNVVLAANPFALEPITVTTPPPTAGQRNERTSIGGASESSREARRFLSDPSDLDALIGLTAGVVPGAGGLSALGAAPDQNSTLLDGMPFEGGALPPDALCGLDVSTTTSSVARGHTGGIQSSASSCRGSTGFRGAQRGSVGSPALSWGSSSSMIQPDRQASLSGFLSGPIRAGRSRYHLSYSFTDRVAQIPSLINPPEELLREFGLAPDSIARLRGLLGAQGIPTAPADGGAKAHSSLGSAYLNAEWSLGSASSVRTTVSVTSLRNRSGGSGGLSFPSLSSSSTRRHGRVLVQGRSYLLGAVAELTSAVAMVESKTTPNRQGAMGIAHVGGINGAISTLRFGSGGVETTTRTMSADLRTELNWVLGDGSHRPNLGAMLHSGRTATESADGFPGTYAFSSLDDLELANPFSYRRVIGASSTAGRARTASIWASDIWRARRHLGVEAGVRLDHLTLGQLPPGSPAVFNQFGLRTDQLPAVTSIAPRIGAAFLLKEQKSIRMRDQNGSMTTFEYVDLNAALGMPQGNLGTGVTIFGTVGAYPGTIGASRVAAVRERTGLPNTRQELICVGDAVPQPDWSSLAGVTFDRCTDGSEATPFSGRQQRVAAFAEGFRPPTVWRANLGLAGVRFGQWQVGGSVVLSYNRSQESVLDLNLDRTIGFTVLAEADRPVFVLPGEIDPKSGSIAPSASRLHQEYGAVESIVSDLTSTATQARLTVIPPPLLNRAYFRVDYVHAGLSLDQRGFRGTTAGDPAKIERIDGGQARHQIVAMTTTRVGQVDLGVRLNLQSGTRFTPMVSADLNGDGFANDRAFVPAEGTSVEPLDGDLVRLLASAPSRVTACLRKQAGSIARPNSCAAGWRARLDLSVDLRSSAWLGLGDRIRLSTRFLNAGAALMRLAGLNASSAQGWQQPDDRLLFVTGFDPSTQRYRYRVNQAFGRPLENGVGSAAFPPFQVQLGVEVALGGRPSRNVVERLGLLPERGVTRDTASIRVALRSLVPSPAAKVLTLGDSLALDGDQRAAIRLVDERFEAKMDSLFAPAVAVAFEKQATIDDLVLMRAYSPALESAFAFRLSARDDVLRLLSKDQVTKLATLVEGWR